MVRYNCIRRRCSVHHAERFADPAPPSGSESGELRYVAYPESAFSRTLQRAVSSRILQYHKPPVFEPGNRLQRDCQHAAVREDPERNKPSGNPTWHPCHFLGMPMAGFLGSGGSVSAPESFQSFACCYGCI